MTNEYLKTTGRIFDIQKFSIHDGPGIRTIIFLKGCPLRCRWCCNPEGQTYDIVEMKMPDGKIKTIGQDITVAELMDKIMMDMPYYRRSGGGVTLSGGEVLTQSDFAAAILRACKENGVNTAIESTAFAKYENIQKLLPYLDVYLMDIKHINSDKHFEFTGVKNEIILENAKRLAKDARKLIIRVPVIPTFNDTPEEIRDIARFTKSLLTVNELHLLPYHRLGSDKYSWLGRDYLAKDFELPNKEKMQRLLEVVKAEGLNCQIGG